jgi:hypothetical protein
MPGVHLSHPSSEQLAAFGLGRLEEAAEAAVESHLADCAICRTVVENLPADALVNNLRRFAQPAGPAPPTDSWAGHEAPTATKTPIAPEEPETPPELARHPRYRVLELLGAGGMGVVYKAEHQLMERPVALKLINQSLIKDPEAVERFRREVKSAARLAHPNIVAAHDAEQSGDVHFLVMEFVEGTSLDRLVGEAGPLPVVPACDYVRQAALGLQHAFERGMVHRDIKPGNLMRTPDGRIKVLDFGLARFARESTPPSVSPAPEGGDRSPEPGVRRSCAPLTRVGTLMGTPDYMAPEQAASLHAADIRADIYSLGCTLYYLLTGEPPFPKGTTVDKLLAHAEQTPRPLTQVRSDVPPELARIVDRMLAKDPMQRYQTPAEVALALAGFLKAVESGAVALEALASQGPQPAENASSGQRRQPRARPGNGLAVLVGCVGGAGGLVALMFLLQKGREDTVNESMATFYLVCALLGGTILVCQFLLGLLGLGWHHDVGGHDFHEVEVHDFHAGHEVAHDAYVAWYAGVLTFRTIVAALTFFGLAGRAAAATGLDPARTLGVALASGVGALFLVAWGMRSLYRLRSDGTIRTGRAVGKTGTVYLSIPAGKAGAGKVLLNLQNRTVEYLAVTSQGPLPTGAKVMVVAVVGPDTVEVIPAPVPEEITHV